MRSNSRMLLQEEEEGFKEKKSKRNKKKKRETRQGRRQAGRKQTGREELEAPRWEEVQGGYDGVRYTPNKHPTLLSRKAHFSVEEKNGRKEEIEIKKETWSSPHTSNTPLSSRQIRSTGGIPKDRTTGGHDDFTCTA